MSTTKTIPDQIRYWIKFYMIEEGLTENDYLARIWPDGMRRVIKKVNALSPVVFNADALSRVTARSKDVIYHCLNYESEAA